MDFLAAFKKRPDGFSLDDDDMLLNEDKKSQTSTYFSAHPFDYCNDEGVILTFLNFSLTLSNRKSI